MTRGALLKSFRLKYFKAVRDSKTIRFSPLTAFIGNNGSGKSSIIEGLETYRAAILDGLDEAMYRWKGFEHIQNRSVRRRPVSNSTNKMYLSNPIHFEMRWDSHRSVMDVATAPSSDQIFIHYESIGLTPNISIQRSEDGKTVLREGKHQFSVGHWPDSRSIYLDPDLTPDSLETRPEYLRRWQDLKVTQVDKIRRDMQRWQFINLNPAAMGSPRPRRRTSGRIDLESDGSNIAEYLLSIRLIDQEAFDGIVEALQYVLPYGRDLQSAITSELERTVYLQLTESDFKIPGWLLSTGTLRVVALLALLRHPDPAPLIVIEEIENGLDPRTINLVVEEIRNAIELKRTQVILTTHSPYLLDLLDLSHIVLVERDSDGQPVFSRPGDRDVLQDWAKQFSPGQLYTMGRLQKSYL